MCRGLGLIVTKTLDIYFSEPENDMNCSHSIILERLGIDDDYNNPFDRKFVRVQYPDWIPESFEFDEENTLPGWARENRQEIINACNKILERVSPALVEYAKVIKAAYAEYENVKDAANAEYEKVKDAANAEYVKVTNIAWEEYIKVTNIAWAEYKKAQNHSYVIMVEQFKTIPGYV